MSGPVPGEFEDLAASMRRFVNTELVPMEDGAPWRNDDEVPAPIVAHVRRRSAELGFYAPDAPEALGGADLPQLGMVVLREHAFAHRARLADYVVSGPEGPTPLLLLGTPAQRERWLRPLVEARSTRCLALTEPDAGSDAQAITTRAERCDGGWVINGRKHFITNAAEADFAIVLAKATGGPMGNEGISAFLVERGAPGFTVGRLIPGMATGSRQYEVMFDDCFVPDNQLLGGEQGLGTAMYSAVQYFAVGRLAIAATCMGMARQALELGMEHARTRHTFGRPLVDYQYVQGHIVDSLIALRAARLLTYEAADVYDSGRPALAESAMAKLHSTETAFQVVDRMMQVFGGMGWTRDLPLERMLRLIKMYRIVDGSSDLQRVIIARSVLGSAR